MSATPSSNATLPFRIGGFESLAAGLDYAAAGRTGCNFFSARGELEQTLPYRDLRERAVDLALRLDGLDLPRGTRIALVADTTPEFLIFFFACQYAGLVPVPLPLSVNFGGRAAYEERLAGMIRTARALAAVASSRADRAATQRRRWLDRQHHRNARRVPCPAFERRRPAAADRRRALLHPVLLRQHQLPARRAGQPACAGQQRRRDRPPRPAAVVRRSLRLLVAALSRHGPGGLLPHAGDDADLDRLHPDHRVRPTPVDLAQGDLRAGRHDLVQPDFRL